MTPLVVVGAGGTRGRSRSSRGSRRRGTRSPPGRAAGGTGAKSGTPARSGRRADRRSSGRAGHRACRSPLAGRHSVPSTRRPSRAVRTTRSPAATRPGASAAAEDGRARVGHLARPRALGGDARARAAATGPAGRVSLSPTAATHAPSGSQPTARHTPSQGEIVAGPRRPPRPRSAASWAVGRDRAWAAAPAPRRADDQVDRGRRGPRCGRQRLAVRRRQRRVADPPDGSPCSRSPSVRTMRSRPSGERRTTWNQPLGIGHVDERAVGQPARPGVVAGLAGDDLLRAGSRRRRARSGASSRSSGRSWAATASVVPSGDQAHAVRRRRRRRSRRDAARAAAGRAAVVRGAGPARR